jgi:hypothetical protein
MWPLLPVDHCKAQLLLYVITFQINLLQTALFSIKHRIWMMLVMWSCAMRNVHVQNVVSTNFGECAIFGFGSRFDVAEEWFDTAASRFDVVESHFGMTVNHLGIAESRFDDYSSQDKLSPSMIPSTPENPLSELRDFVHAIPGPDSKTEPCPVPSIEVANGRPSQETDSAEGFVAHGQQPAAVSLNTPTCRSPALFLPMQPGPFGLPPRPPNLTQETATNAFVEPSENGNPALAKTNGLAQMAGNARLEETPRQSLFLCCFVPKNLMSDQAWEIAGVVQGISAGLAVKTGVMSSWRARALYLQRQSGTPPPAEWHSSCSCILA